MTLLPLIFPTDNPSIKDSKGAGWGDSGDIHFTQAQTKETFHRNSPVTRIALLDPVIHKQSQTSQIMSLCSLHLSYRKPQHQRFQVAGWDAFTSQPLPLNTCLKHPQLGWLFCLQLSMTQKQPSKYCCNNFPCLVERFKGGGLLHLGWRKVSSYQISFAVTAALDLNGGLKMVPSVCFFRKKKAALDLIFLHLSL